MRKLRNLDGRSAANLLMFLSLLPLISFARTTIAATPNEDPLIHALERIETTDWDNRWLGYGMAITGSAVSIGMGSWALSEPVLNADKLILASSVALVGMAASQIIHGGMRFDERVQSARTARTLLKQPKLRQQNALFFLRQRAQTSRSTRFWGATMTTLQGVATAALGAGIMLNSRVKNKGNEELVAGEEWQTTGQVILGLGLLNTAVGAIHFPGLTRPEKILKRVQLSSADKTIFSESETAIAPLKNGPNNTAQPAQKIREDNAQRLISTPR